MFALRIIESEKKNGLNDNDNRRKLYNKVPSVPCLAKLC